MFIDRHHRRSRDVLANRSLAANASGVLISGRDAVR